MTGSQKLVKIERIKPNGEIHTLGTTQRNILEITRYAMVQANFNFSKYHIAECSCRSFCGAMASFLGLFSEYATLSGSYYFAWQKSDERILHHI